MLVNLKPSLKRVLPTVAIAALTFSNVLANQKETNSSENNFDKIEYLQADKYERQENEKIAPGLTRQEAYKDAALKSKFDIANINNDHYINETEAKIYNWSNNKYLSFDGDMLQSGLVLTGIDRTEMLPNHSNPTFYIYPGQEESTLKYPVEKRIFRATDKNIDGTLSPTEVLRYIKSQEFEYFDTEIKDLEAQIVRAQEKREIKNPNLRKKFLFNAIHSLFLGLGIGIFAFAGDDKYSIKKYIASTTLALLMFGVPKTTVEIIQHNKKWKNVEQKAMAEKETLLPLREKTAKELNYLDEQI